MASVGNDPNGTKRILFVGNDGKRRTVRLGDVTVKTAETIRGYVEDLASASANGQAMKRSTALWLADISDKLHKRLAKVGLVEARAPKVATKLGLFVDTYIAGRIDAKPLTIAHLKRAAKELTGFLSADKVMAKVTAGDADGYRLHLLGKGMAENTVRRLCGRARQFFKAAMRHDLLTRNPFDGIKTTVGGNPDRLYFLSRADAQKVLDACTDLQWKLLFVLSRFAGLRCPSEHLALQWGDIDWEKNMMTVRSPKTEQYEGKASRIIPIFPEVRPHLLKVFEEAEDGETFVITRYRRANSNLRTQFERIIARAGLKPWPKLFHNLRSTRETELAESYPLHVVCAWIGNSQPVAAKHYLQVTDDHVARAVAGDDKTAHNSAQQASANRRNEGKTTLPENTETPVLQGVSGDCKNMQDNLMPPEGLAQQHENKQKTAGQDESGTQSGTVRSIPDDLSFVIARWETLAPALRAGIVAMIRST